MRILIVVALCVVACARPDTSVQPSSTDDPISDRGQLAAYADTASITTRLASVDTVIKNHPERLRFYARLPGHPDLVPVDDTLAWPPDTEVSYNIVFDSAGTPLFHREVPTSESGDWFMAVTHYMAPNGRTLFYEYYSSSFNSECTSILRETIRIFIDPSTGEQIATTRAFADGDGTQIVDTAGCYLRSNEAPEPVLAAADLQLPRQRR